MRKPLQPFKAHLRPFYFLLRKLRAGQMTLSELAYTKHTYYSQFGEDVYLERYFLGQNTGFYVDIGAFHPYNISNTLVFYKRGWRGINVEPNPASFNRFPVHRPRDINLNLAVSHQREKVNFSCLEERSGIDDETYVQHNHARSQPQCLVEAMPLSDILHAHLPPETIIDFMTIDCEGHDLVVLQSNDWTSFRPNVLVVEEHSDTESPVALFLKDVGYEFVRDIGLSKIFVEQNFKHNHP